MTDESLALVVAIDRERGIGKDGGIPWRVPEDVRHFKGLTRRTEAPGAENAVIMGRVTWSSIPPKFRPLSGRINIVLSRRPDLSVPAGVFVASDFERAVQRARAAGAERVFVIGGAAVYAQALGRPGCREVYLTTLDRSFACDTHLPPLPGDFAVVEELARGQSAGVPYRIERWQRQGPDR